MSLPNNGIMTEPVYDYYATRIVQDLEDDLYEGKERIQRLRRQKEELAAENERLREGIEFLRNTVTDAADACEQTQQTQKIALAENFREIAKELTDLLDGDTE